jgi:hypothetical protein
VRAVSLSEIIERIVQEIAGRGLGSDKLGEAEAAFIMALLGEIDVVKKLEIVQRLLSADEWATMIQNGEYGEMAIAAAELIPVVGLFMGTVEGYFHLGEELGNYVPVPDWATDAYDAVTGWWSGHSVGRSESRFAGGKSW